MFLYNSLHKYSWYKIPYIRSVKYTLCVYSKQAVRLPPWGLAIKRRPIIIAILIRHNKDTVLFVSFKFDSVKTIPLFGRGCWNFLLLWNIYQCSVLCSTMTNSSHWPHIHTESVVLSEWWSWKLSRSGLVGVVKGPCDLLFVVVILQLSIACIGTAL